MDLVPQGDKLMNKRRIYLLLYSIFMISLIVGAICIDKSKFSINNYCILSSILAVVSLLSIKVLVSIYKRTKDCNTKQMDINLIVFNVLLIVLMFIEFVFYQNKVFIIEEEIEFAHIEREFSRGEPILIYNMNKLSISKEELIKLAYHYDYYLENDINEIRGELLSVSTNSILIFKINNK